MRECSGKGAGYGDQEVEYIFGQTHYSFDDIQLVTEKFRLAIG